MNRKLDGCYFRMQRDGKWGPVCFSDLTEEERNLEMFSDRTAEWWKSLACHLADCLKEIGEQFDICRE